MGDMARIILRAAQDPRVGLEILYEHTLPDGNPWIRYRLIEEQQVLDV